MENTDNQNKHRAVSVEFISNSGGFAVKAVRGQKEPAKGWDPKKNDKNKSSTLLITLAHTTDNIGVHLHGNIVDVDVDGKNPYLQPALEAFLPPCAHIWGRKSKPRSHRVYQIKGPEAFDPGQYPLLKRLARIRDSQKNPEVAVELRGGDVGRGEYSLLPGSVHPSGEDYEWDDLERAKSTLSIVTADRLMEAVRLAGAAAVIAPYWMDGMRNDMVMGLSGFLHRIHKIAESLAEDGEYFSVNEEDALRLLNVICDITDDDPTDKVARVKTLKQTWKKAETGKPVTGATTIAELTGDKHIVQKLYTLLADSPDINTIEEFTTRFAIWQGPGVIIDLDAVSKGADKPVMSRPNFANSYGHRFIRTPDGKRYAATEMLWTLSAAMRTAGLTFEPGSSQIVETRQGTKINQWSGFEIPPYNGKVTEKDVEPFLKHLKEIIASDDEKIYNWVLHWIAHIFAAPAKRSKTALVLVGKPGAGKSILGHNIIKPIIGTTHAAATNTIDSITKDFNALFGMKIFIQCDEAINNKQRAQANRLKALVTDDEQKIEAKFMDAYISPNHSRFLFTSNDVEDAIFLNDGLDDRRYTIVEVSPKMRNKRKEYWEPYVNWLDDTENLAKIHRYLVDLEIDWSLITRPLNTQAKVVMQQRSMGPFDKWLASMLDRGHPLASEVHNFWFDAPILNEETKKWSAAQKGSGAIDRRNWPEGINPIALVADYTRFVRASHRGADMLDASQIGQSFIQRKLQAKGTARRQVTVEYVDRDERRHKTRVTWKPFPSFEQIHAFLERNYGVEYAKYDDVADDPETKDEF